MLWKQYGCKDYREAPTMKQLASDCCPLKASTFPLLQVLRQRDGRSSDLQYLYTPPTGPGRTIRRTEYIQVICKVTLVEVFYSSVPLSRAITNEASYPRNRQPDFPQKLFHI
jgi:hypothetical protein